MGIPVANVNPMVHRTNHKLIHPKKKFIHRIDEENDKESSSASSEKDDSFDSYASLSENTSPTNLGKTDLHMSGIDQSINLGKKIKKRKKSLTGLTDVNSNKELSPVKVKKKKLQ